MVDKIKNKLGYVPCIYLDAGHGLETKGKQTPKLEDGTIIKEKTLNDGVKKELITLCKEFGLGVVDVSPGNTDIPLNVRVKTANEHYIKGNKGVFISIHYNSGTGVWGNNKGGIESFYYDGSSESKRLTECIQSELVKGTHQANRGVKVGGDWAVLRDTKMTATLLELGFMDYKPEALLMLNKDFYKECAMEILEGIKVYYGLSGILVEKEDKHWVDGDVEYLNSIGISLTDKRYDDVCTRAEMLTMLARLHRVLTK